MLRKVLFILSGNATASLLTLVRNLVIARLITVEDYGIAATFAVVMSIVEMLSTLGLQQQIIQSKSGNDPSFQAGLQGFNVLRGVIAGAILFVAAEAIGNFLKIPEVAWAYQCMALVPVFNGLMHFDIHRLTRGMNYFPGIMTQALPAFLALLMVWPLYLTFGDYRVMLYSVIAQFGLMMVTSHILAERRFAVSLNRPIMMEALQFGWPLLFNNILLFAVFNGDKMIIGREIGLEDLAIFAMGLTLTLTPTLVMAKSVQNFFLPQLSASQNDDATFNRLAAVTLQAVILLSVLFVIGVVLVGGPVVHVLLGDKYLPLLPLLTWLAVMQAVRVLKAGGAIVALAKGQTSNAMIANSVRILSLIPAWYVARETGNLLHIIWIATAGEILGFVVSVWLVATRLKLPLRELWGAFSITVIVLGSASGVAWLYSTPQLAGSVPNWPIWLAALGLSGVSFYVMGALRRYIRSRQMTQFNEDVA